MFYWIEKADSSFFLTSLTSKGSAKPNPEGRNKSLSFLWIEAVIEAKAFAIPEGSPCWLNVCYSSRKCEFGPRIERKVKERGEWCFVSSSRSRVGIHENREVSYGFRTGRSEKSWNESPATRGAILRLYYINSLSGFSNRWEQGEEFGTKRIGNGAALQMNSRCMCSCSRKHSQSLPGAGLR